MVIQIMTRYTAKVPKHRELQPRRWHRPKALELKSLSQVTIKFLPEIGFRCISK